jgi:uncharacterized protein (DUF427 family)
MTSGHVVTTEPSTKRVEVRVGGVEVASSDRPVLLHETGLPTRYYLPRDDVRMELFRPTTFTTQCPFKGTASYLSLDLDGESHDGIVWSYEEPLDAAADIAGLVCFYPDRVELTVDGQRVA